MENYYDEVLREIQDLMDQNRIDEAMYMVEKELTMPYVPMDVEKTLIQLKKELRYAKSEKESTKEDTLEEILARLKGDERSQLAAAVALISRNLRECLPEIKDYLKSNPCQEAAALLIEAIGQQNIDEEFVLVKDDVEYTFWGNDITSPSESKGFLQAEQYLKDWLANDNPDFYEMARTLLIHETYIFLPLEYEEAESLDLALEMVDMVSELMDDGQTASEIRRKAGKPLNLINKMN